MLAILSLVCIALIAAVLLISEARASHETLAHPCPQCGQGGGVAREVKLFFLEKGTRWYGIPTKLYLVTVFRTCHSIVLKPDGREEKCGYIWHKTPYPKYQTMVRVIWLLLTENMGCLDFDPKLYAVAGITIQGIPHLRSYQPLLAKTPSWRRVSALVGPPTKRAYLGQ